MSRERDEDREVSAADLLREFEDDLEPMIIQAIAAVNGTLRVFLDSNDFFQLTAKMYRKMYVSLVEAGFSPEEAMNIVSRQSFHTTK